MVHVYRDISIESKTINKGKRVAVCRNLPAFRQCQGGLSELCSNYLVGQMRDLGLSRAEGFPWASHRLRGPHGLTTTRLIPQPTLSLSSRPVTPD